MILHILRPRGYGCLVVFALRGELDLLDADDIAAVLAAAVVRNPLIVLDLTALTFIDCYSLGALVRVRTQARQAGGDLLLAAPHGSVLRILTLTELIDVFAVHASVEHAVQAAEGPFAAVS
jgi:anti-sigma B factor antagonist